ncbi:hypothetical protein PFISCL1PPCAC_3541, partial [Pristionchus fissidentatus]
MVVPIATVYRIVSLIAIVFSIVNILFLFVLQCSRDPSLHTPFYRIFKVNVIYAVAHMLSRTNFIECFTSPFQLVFIDAWSVRRLRWLFLIQFAIPLILTGFIPDLGYSTDAEGCYLY